MNNPTVFGKVRNPLTPISPRVEVARIIVGAVVGALAGICFGAIVYDSLVVALAGAMGGAVFGMIGAAKYCEGEVE